MRLQTTHAPINFILQGQGQGVVGLLLRWSWRLLQAVLRAWRGLGAAGLLEFLTGREENIVNSSSVMFPLRSFGDRNRPIRHFLLNINYIQRL